MTNKLRDSHKRLLATLKKGDRRRSLASAINNAPLLSEISKDNGNHDTTSVLPSVHSRKIRLLQRHRRPLGEINEREANSDVDAGSLQNTQTQGIKLSDISVSYGVNLKRPDDCEKSSLEENTSDKENWYKLNRPIKRPKVFLSKLEPNAKNASFGSASVVSHQSSQVSQEDQISSGDDADLHLEKLVEMTQTQKAKNQKDPLPTGSSFEDDKYTFNYDVRQRKLHGIEEPTAVNKSFRVSDIVDDTSMNVTKLSENAHKERRLINISNENLGTHLNSSEKMKEDANVFNVLQDLKLASLGTAELDEVIKFSLKELFFPKHFLITSNKPRARLTNDATIKQNERVTEATEEVFDVNYINEEEPDGPKYYNGEQNQELMLFKLSEIVEKVELDFKDYRYLTSNDSHYPTEKEASVTNGTTIDKRQNEGQLTRGEGHTLSSLAPSRILLKFRQISPTLYYSILSKVEGGTSDLQCYLVKYNMRNQKEFLQHFKKGARIRIFADELLESAKQNGRIAYYSRWKVVI